MRFTEGLRQVLLGSVWQESGHTRVKFTEETQEGTVRLTVAGGRTHRGGVSQVLLGSLWQESGTHMLTEET